MPEFITVARVDELPPGSARQVTVEGRWVGLFNVDGVFHAVDNLCLHRGGPLCEGSVRGTVVTCPWHGWQFDVSSGALVQDPTTGVSHHETRIVDGNVQVKLSD